MANLDPEEAATIAHGKWAEGHPLTPLTSFAIDTRLLEHGQTFVALETDKRDGHDFIENAALNGALAAMVERPNRDVHLPQLVVRDSLASLQSLARVWRQRFNAPVIGISGSFGKTTVKEMLGTVMGSQWHRTRGNMNNAIGVPLSILQLEPTHDAGAILEAGINTTGEMDLLAELIDPSMVIITAVGPAHLEGLGGIDGVATEKARLAKAVRPGGIVIIPANLLQYEAFRTISADVSVHALLIDGLPGEDINVDGLDNVTLYHYKWTENQDSRGAGSLSSNEPALDGGLSFMAGSPGMVSNLALVVHAAMQLGVPKSTIDACLEGWRPFEYRGEIYRCGEQIFFVDCYNANPASMIDSAHRFKKQFAGQPHLYVLGSMNELGDSSEHWHRQTAQDLDLPENARVFLVGYGAEWMKGGLISSNFPEDQIHIVEDLDPVRQHLKAFSGAVFLKASRTYKLETLLQEGAVRC